MSLGEGVIILCFTYNYTYKICYYIIMVYLFILLDCEQFEDRNMILFISVSP